MKILTTLLLILLSLTPLFASAGTTNGPQSTENATLVVQTKVEPIKQYGFLYPGINDFGGIKTTTFQNIGPMFLTSNIDVYSSAPGIIYPNPIYVGVKTNSADKVTITLKHTDLKCSEHTIPVKIRIDGGAEFAQGQIIPVLNSTQDTEKGARAIVKELGLTFNSQEAAAGTYTATLTMTVTGA